MIFFLWRLSETEKEMFLKGTIDEGAVFIFIFYYRKMLKQFVAALLSGLKELDFKTKLSIGSYSLSQNRFHVAST